MESSCKKHERDILLRKVRIILSDPYATDDSSSDESLELPKTQKVKRIVHEINLQSQLSKSSKDRCDSVKTSRKKPPRKSKKPVGVRLMPSGRWAADITNPFTKTRKRLGTYETPEEAEKAYADKKVEYSELTSSGPAVSSLVSVISANSQCLRSAASPPCVNADDLCKKEMSSNKDVVVSDDPTNEMYFNFDFSDLQIPDLSFLPTEEYSMVSSANCGELDFDRFFMDDESGHLLDDFSLLGSDFNICGFGNSIPSELPECDFSDVELELGDLKFASADPLGGGPPLNIACP